jgi:hypothetical protein
MVGCQSTGACYRNPLSMLENSANNRHPARCHTAERGDIVVVKAIAVEPSG